MRYCPLSLLGVLLALSAMLGLESGVAVAISDPNSADGLAPPPPNGAAPVETVRHRRDDGPKPMGGYGGSAPAPSVEVRENRGAPAPAPAPREERDNEPPPHTYGAPAVETREKREPREQNSAFLP